MTELFTDFLFLLIAVTLFSVIGRWLPIPNPVILTLGGLGLSFIPHFQDIQLDPEIFFIAFLPPLLFADGWQMPIRELIRYKRPIILLVFGLVSFTIFGVGFMVKALIPEVPWAMAFALGAVVSPTDAVAVSAITKKLKIPSRLVAILNGESLLNDATGLVAFRFALLAAAAGAVSVGEISLSFTKLALGGLALGFLIGYLAGKLRDFITYVKGGDAMVEITLSLSTPFLAYLAAVSIDVSAILTVVAAGLYSGWRDPIKMSVETRQKAWAVWEIVIYWLNGLAFLLLGITGPSVINAVSDDFTTTQLILYPILITVVAVGGRILWMYPSAYIPRALSKRIREREERPNPQAIFVVAWAGMRGAVTLAAALSIPLLLPSGEAFPARDIVIYLALGVVTITLIVQGITLEPLIRWFGLEADQSHEEEENMARIAAVSSGLDVLCKHKETLENPVEIESIQELIQEYEHRLDLLESENLDTMQDTRTRICSSQHFHLIALEAERKAIDKLWRQGKLHDDVHRPLQFILDYEESMLTNKSI